MRKLLVLFAIALAYFVAAGQSIPFERLDSFSTYISQLQKQTEGKSYKVFNGDDYELSFPEENFKVWSYNKLATLAVYKKSGGKEVLWLTENIDFKKATGITIEDYKGTACIRVSFQKDHLTMQLIENGKVTATEKEYYLEFFCKYGALDADGKLVMDKMFFTLAELASQLKIEKGLMKEEAWKKELADWPKMSSKDFVVKHPVSLLSAQAKLLVNEERMKEEVTLKKNQKYVLEFVAKYNYRPGISLSEFAALDPKNKDIVDRKVKVDINERHKFYTRSNMHFFTVETGPFHLISDESNTVRYLKYIVAKGNASKKALKLYEIVQELKRNVDEKYIEIGYSAESPKDLSFVEVKVPGLGLNIKAYNSNTVDIVFEYN
jgi:hypothetical protein